MFASATSTGIFRGALNLAKTMVCRDFPVALPAVGLFFIGRYMSQEYLAPEQYEVLSATFTTAGQYLIKVGAGVFAVLALFIMWYGLFATWTEKKAGYLTWYLFGFALEMLAAWIIMAEFPPPT